MSIQSTIDLTREEAEKKYLCKVLGEEGEVYKIYKAKAILMSDKELEEAIEEYFYNYSITNSTE